MGILSSHSSAMRKIKGDKACNPALQSIKNMCAQWMSTTSQCPLHMCLSREIANSKKNWHHMWPEWSRKHLKRNLKTLTVIIRIMIRILQVTLFMLLIFFIYACLRKYALFLKLTQVFKLFHLLLVHTHTEIEWDWASTGVRLVRYLLWAQI